MDATTGAIVASVINTTGLNCSNTSSSSSSSGSGSNNNSSSNSSSSSGYASGHSTVSTPATPLSSHYDTPTHTALTPVSVAEHLPTATVAPVTPYYSESTLAHHHQQPHQQHQQQQQLQQQQQQQQQQQRQQYYAQSYTYPQYDHVYDTYTGNSYYNLKPPNSNSSSSNNHQRLEKSNKNNASSIVAQQSYASATPTTTTSATTKPQATATPFFAQPSASSVNAAASAAYYDTYSKYKMPSSTKLSSQTVSDYASYTNHLQHAAAAAATLSYQQQQQHYYAAAKSQLQDANYAAAAAAAAVVKPHRQHAANNSASYYGSSSAYFDKYDKYMYAQTASSAAYGAAPTHAIPPHPPPPPHHYSPHEPTTADPYRKAAAAAAASAWHWNMEYAAAAGNCRTLPPSGATASSYLSSSNTSATARDPFCASSAADKYGKYDKYSAYYASHHPQQYIAPPPSHAAISGSTSAQTSRNLWSNTTHHTAQHLAPVLNERLSHTLPPSAPHPPQHHQHAHTHPHATHHPFASATGAATQRQSCCSQPFQQQSCYYPRPTQQHTQSVYTATPQSHYGSSSSNGSASQKYGSATYGSNYKTSNSNDLYLTSPFDTPPSAYNYASASTAAIQQRYSGLPAALRPTAIGSNDPSAAFYNDLSMQSAFENYASNPLSQATMLQSHAAPPSHLSYQTHGSSQNSASTVALLEYRKPSTASSSDCCMSTTRTSLGSLEAPSYFNYDLHTAPVAHSHGMITSPTTYSDGGSSSEKSTPTTKNLSLRDFLTTWNEEEEEDLSGATAQLNFIEGAQTVIENVESATNYAKESKAEHMTPQVPLVQQSQQQQQPTTAAEQATTFPYKPAYQARPKIHVGITVDGAMDVETSQYINLPDIIIDIEKSNNVTTPGAQAAPPSSTPTSAPQHHHHSPHSPCGAEALFENFDVEKELDELQIKRAKLCLEKQLNNEIEILTPEPMVSPNTPPKSNDDTQPKCNESNEYENLTTVHHSECEKSYEHAEQFLKEMELNESGSNSSNSSTFEKEYETFINKIEHVKDETAKEPNPAEALKPITPPVTNEDSASVSHESSDIKTPPNPMELAEVPALTSEESSQNLQDFTMFYKKKRKLMQESMETPVIQPPAKIAKPLEEVVTPATTLAPILNEPTKAKSSKRKSWKRISNKKQQKLATLTTLKRRRPTSQFYKALRCLNYGRTKIRTNTTLVQKHIALAKERHLPLIKRQSFKNFSTCDKIVYNPRSLKCLTVTLVNTLAFQAHLLNDFDKELKSQLYCSKVSENESEDCKLISSNGMRSVASEAAELKVVSTTIETETTADALDDEQNSMTTSENWSASLKEQDDFVGFEDQDTMTRTEVATSVGSNAVSAELSENQLSNNSESQNLNSENGNSESDDNELTNDTNRSDNSAKEIVIKTVEKTGYSDQIDDFVAETFVDAEKATKTVVESFVDSDKVEDTIKESLADSESVQEAVVESLADPKNFKDTNTVIDNKVAVIQSITQAVEMIKCNEQVKEIISEATFSSEKNENVICNDDDEDMLSENNQKDTINEATLNFTHVQRKFNEQKKDENLKKVTDMDMEQQQTHDDILKSTKESSSSEIEISKVDNSNLDVLKAPQYNFNESNVLRTPSAELNDEKTVHEIETASVTSMKRKNSDVAIERSKNSEDVQSATSSDFGDDTDEEEAAVEASPKHPFNVEVISNDTEQVKPPVMRTKASLKFCEFNLNELLDTNNSEPVSLILSKTNNMESSTKELTASAAVETNKRATPQSTEMFDAKSALDEVEKIDKAKFVEKWAASINMTATKPTHLVETPNESDCIDLTQDPIKQEVMEDTITEALDLSPSSRLLTKTSSPEPKKPVELDENSNSSTSSNSSSSSSSASSDDNASTSSASSSTSTAQSTASTTTTQSSSSDDSTDGSDFNELRALERELSQHKTCDERTNAADDRLRPNAVNTDDDMNAAKKTDALRTQNIKTTATNQDIAELKKILGSEHDDIAAEEMFGKQKQQNEIATVAIKVEVECDEENVVAGNEVANEDFNKRYHAASLKDITEAFIMKSNTKLADNNDAASLEQVAVAVATEQQKSKQKNVQQHVRQHVDIPKLSDLCKIALNSSFVLSDLNEKTDDNIIAKKNKMMSIKKSIPPSPLASASTTKPLSPPQSPATPATSPKPSTPPPSPPSCPTVRDSPRSPCESQRELTVEEAFAEMYRQAGVASDPEDNADERLATNQNGENQAQDILLINLAEILENNDSESNIYVLQCDVNENILRVMTTAHNDSNVENNEPIESVNALQLVQILNANDLEIIAATEPSTESVATQTIDPALLPSLNSPDTVVDVVDMVVNSSTDLPIIHHEEIVPDNYRQFEREQFLKYLHEKYVQKHVNKYYHANRILKKYRRFLSKKIYHASEAAQQRTRT